MESGRERWIPRERGSDRDIGMRERRGRYNILFRWQCNEQFRTN